MRDVFELDAEILGDHLAAGQHRDVFEHGLAAIAEARRLDGRDLEAAAQLVDDQRRQRFAFDVLGDDQQRPAALHHRLEDRQQRLQIAELLLVDEDQRLLQLDAHLVGVGDEIRAEIAAVELHAFDDLELGLGGLGLLDRDDALIADLLHGSGDHLADRGIAIGGNGADLGDLVGRFHLLGARLDVLDDRGDGEIDAALEVHRIEAGGDQLVAFAQDRGGEHGRRGGAVAGKVVGLGGDFAHQLRAHVLELVGELDLLGDGDAVLGDARRAVGALDDDVAALGAERHLDGVVEDFDAAQHAVAGIAAEFDFLGRHCSGPVRS